MYLNVSLESFHNNVCKLWCIHTMLKGKKKKRWLRMNFYQIIPIKLLKGKKQGVFTECCNM